MTAAPAPPPAATEEEPAAPALEEPAQAHALETSAPGSPKAAPGGKKGGPHHLLRHELTPAIQEAAAAVLCADGTPEEAATDIWRLQQRELRVVFEKVYGVPTSSCNNGWMRGKILQALGLGAHWQPPRESAQPEGSAGQQQQQHAAAAAAAAAAGEAGAEVSRFGRRVRRRRWESSDHESADDSSAGPAPSQRDAPRKPVQRKRARPAANASASGSVTASPVVPGLSGATAGDAWQAVAVQPWQVHPMNVQPVLCGAPAASAGDATTVAAASASAAGPQHHVRIVVRQPSNNGRDGLETVLVGPSAPLPTTCTPPGLPPHAGSPTTAHQAVECAPASAAAPPLDLPPVSMGAWHVSQPGQAVHAHPCQSYPESHPQQQQQQQYVHYLSQQQQLGGSGAPCTCGGSDSATSGGASVDPTSLRFYEEQQRIYQLRRQQVEHEMRRELQQRLETQQRWQEMATYAAAAARSATPPPLPPQAAALLQLVPHDAAGQSASAAAMAAVAQLGGHPGMPLGRAAHAGPSLFSQHAAAMQAQGQAQMLSLPPLFLGTQGLPAGAHLGAADGARLAALFWPDHAAAGAAAAPPATSSAAEAAQLAASPMHVLPPPAWDLHAVAPSPFAAEAAAAALCQQVPPGRPPLPLGYRSGAADCRPLVGMHKTVSQELHTLYSAWQDGQMSLSMSSLASLPGM